MVEVSVSDFSKNCSRLIGQINRTNETLRITHHGGPIAEVTPARNVGKRFVLGDMVGSAEIVVDVVSPVLSLEQIEARRE